MGGIKRKNKKTVSQRNRRKQKDKGESEAVVFAPHSIIIRRGLLGNRIVSLVKDFRRVMSPYTATDLRERKRNTIKDFVSVAGQLHVTHLIVFSQSRHTVQLRIGKIPHGPTLEFAVLSYVISADIVSSQKKSYANQKLYDNFPLAIYSGFSTDSSASKEMRLVITFLQNMFPAIRVEDAKLSDFRRCVLFRFDESTGTIEFRHYAIKFVPVGLSRGIKKIVQGRVPNLAQLKDISELITKANLLSESEYEEDEESQVVLPQDVHSRGNMKDEKSAVRLYELGPRLVFKLNEVYQNLMGVNDAEKVYKTTDEGDGSKTANIKNELKTELDDVEEHEETETEEETDDDDEDEVNRPKFKPAVDFESDQKSVKKQKRQQRRDNVNNAVVTSEKPVSKKRKLQSD